MLYIFERSCSLCGMKMLPDLQGSFGLGCFSLSNQADTVCENAQTCVISEHSQWPVELNMWSQSNWNFQNCIRHRIHGTKGNFHRHLHLYTNQISVFSWIGKRFFAFVPPVSLWKIVDHIIPSGKEGDMPFVGGYAQTPSLETGTGSRWRCLSSKTGCEFNRIE